MIESSTTISDLDVRSFQHLLSYLRYVDKLKLLLVVKSIAKFAEKIIDSEPFNIFHVQIHFSAEEIKQLLIDYGHHVKRLRYTEWFSDETTIAYAKLLPEHCPNLQDVYFSELEITMTNIYGQILSSAHKTIEKLTLENCTVIDPACSLVANLFKLKLLNLQCSKLSGEDLGRLQNLTDLNLRNCKNFLSENFIDLLKSNKLVKLNLEGFDQLSENVVDMLLKTQSILKVLTVGNNLKGYHAILRMKSLREISMSKCDKNCVLAYLKELVANRIPIESLEINEPYSDCVAGEIVDHIIQLDNLRGLSIRNSKLFKNHHLLKIAKFCRNIELLDLYRTCFNDLGILGCLEHLKHLRHLNVSCLKLNKSLYSRIVGIREELDFTTKLIVYIQPKMELEEILKSDEYAANMAFVQLTQSSKRTVSDTSMLERLEHLNLTHCNDNRNIIRKAPRLTMPLSSQTPSLLDLDDYSLRHIMEYLPLFDQLKLALSNSRFENIIKYFLSTNPFRVGEVLTSFTFRDVKNLLSRCGHVVKILHVRLPEDHFNAEMFDLVSKYFTNVVELKRISPYHGLSSCEKELVMKVIKNSRDSLEVIDFQSKFTDEQVSLEISKASKLHTLIFRHFKLTGVHLDTLTNLTTLNLSCVTRLEPATFIAICKSNQLKSLNIIGCCKLNNQSFEVLVETQNNLETLAIGYCYDATNTCLIRGLINLKDLEYVHCFPEELFLYTDTAAEIKTRQLQFLAVRVHIDLDDSDDSDDSVHWELSENIATLQNLVYLRLQANVVLDIDCVTTIAKGCPLLKALDVNDNKDFGTPEFFETIRLFKNLRHLDVSLSGCYMVYTYNDVLKIIMKEPDRGSLVLYDFWLYKEINNLTSTRDYINNKKYLEISDAFLAELNIYELVEEETPESQNNAKLWQPHRQEAHSLKPNILDMSGSCLQKIASYLQPIDTLAFAYVHKTIAISIETTLEYLLHSLNDIARIFTVAEARHLFAAYAGRIKRIQLSTTDKTRLIDYINLLQPYRSYITELDITWDGDNRFGEAELLFDKKAQTLQKLTLKRFGDPGQILQYLKFYSSELSIRTLDLSDSYSRVEYIDKFHNITDLNLRGCKITTKNFQKICRSCKLKRLNIMGVEGLDEFAFRTLVETQNDHLEQLSISCSYKACNSTIIATLENVRHIAIAVNVQLSEFKNFLKMLVQYRRYDLEYLEIISAVEQQDLQICIYDMVEEVQRNFRNLKDIVVKGFTEPLCIKQNNYMLKMLYPLKCHCEYYYD